MRTAEEILRDIVTDVNAMRHAELEGSWFGMFDNSMIDSVEWPNLDILVKEAETALGIQKGEDK